MENSADVAIEMENKMKMTGDSFQSDQGAMQ